jgi:hypothetical protein
MDGLRVESVGGNRKLFAAYGPWGLKPLFLGKESIAALEALRRPKSAASAQCRSGAPSKIPND